MVNNISRDFSSDTGNIIIIINYRETFFKVRLIILYTYMNYLRSFQYGHTSWHFFFFFFVVVEFYQYIIKRFKQISKKIIFLKEKKNILKLIFQFLTIIHQEFTWVMVNYVRILQYVIL